MARSKFGDWLAPDADAAWRAANREALALGHAWFGTEHLLLGLLYDPAVRILAAHRVTLAGVREALVRDLDGPRLGTDEALLGTLGVDLAAVRAHVEASFGPGAIDELYARRRRRGRRLARGPLCGMAMCPRAKLALERARRAAKAERRSLVTSTDLLAGVLEIGNALAVRVLRALGVDPDALRAELRPRVDGGRPR